MIKGLIEKIRDIPDCEVLFPAGFPSKEKHLLIPDDITEFYELCGGLILFKNRNYPISIVKPEKFLPANPIIVGERCEEDISSGWYIIADDMNGDYLTIDLNQERLGRCYDSFYDRHGVVGSCPIVAKSFSELLERLVNNKGQHWYWLERDFVSLGDAYDE
jgi:hypothetical protein